MHLLIDVQALQSPNTRSRGIDRYARNLFSALAAVRKDWHIELVQTDHFEPIDQRALEGLRLTTFELPLSGHPTHVGVNELYYADWLTARRPDAILLASAFDEHVLYPKFLGKRPSLFIILYDLIPLLFHEQFLTRPGAAAAYGERARRVLKADGVLAISQATADDFRVLADQTTPTTSVIFGAPETSFRPLPALDGIRYRDRWRRRFGINHEFVLYVGGFDFRKNLRGAIQAFARLPHTIRAQLEFVIACHFAAPHREQVLNWAREFGVADSLKLTGYLSDEELRAMYSLCRVFFFPSLYEGLGLPVLEALQCGAPVVASNCSSVPEVAGTASWLANPESAADNAAALAEALAEPRDARIAERMAHASQFTWERTAHLAAAALSTNTNNQRPMRRPHRRRLAWVSPVPPTVSGIADYSAELLEPLAARYDIELVVSPNEMRVDAHLAQRFLVIGADEVSVRHAARPYDLFVYQVGNSHHHLYMLDLLRRYRGLMVLHDFYLGGLVLPATQNGGWPVSLAKELELDGEPRLASQLRSVRIGPHEVIDRVPLNRRILSQARAVIVHSMWSWERVRNQVRVPAARIPHAATIPELKSPAEERRRLGLPLDRFIVATLGFIGKPKRIASLLRAASALPLEIREKTELVIVGYAPPSEAKVLRDLAADLGLTSQVRFIGRVKLDDFAAYARAADVCVQLRYPTRGETSGALLRELAAGAACIVSDHGSIAELPDTVAIKVRTPDHEVRDLTAALCRLYSRPDERRRLAQAGVEYVTQHHSLQSVVERYSTMIEFVAAQRESDDSHWCEHACDALASSTDSSSAHALIAEWAGLRSQGRRHRPTQSQSDYTANLPTQAASAQY